MIKKVFVFRRYLEPYFTFRQSVDAQLDMGEVSAADFASHLVEANAPAHSQLAHDPLILAHVQVELLEGRQTPRQAPALVVRADVRAVMPAPAGMAWRRGRPRVGPRGHGC